MAAKCPKTPGARVSEKNVLIFFEIHRTSDTSIASVALSNLANGLYGIHTSHIRVYGVN